MAKFKEILKKIFCLPPVLTVLIAVPSFLLDIIALSMDPGGAISYVAYLLSAYALVLVIVRLVIYIRTPRRGLADSRIGRKITGIPLFDRLLRDVFFRTEIMLYPGLLINLLYALIKLFSGIYYRSLWFGALAVYYILLALMRFLLLRSARRHPLGQNLAHELRWYRICGIFLLFMNQALAVIVILVVHQNKGFRYPGLLIYAMALYAFYAVISAAVSLVSYRKHGSPVMSATRAVKLTAALVSMLSLETAMLTQFGSGDTGRFRQVMTGVTGGVVCALVLGMAVFMIASSTKQMKKRKGE